MRAIRLRVSDLKNAFGIDIKHPRFSWKCEGALTQTAYRLIMTLEGGQLLYDSGRVESGYR